MSGLMGKHIITTCASNKADRLHNLLSKKGALVYNYPMIKTTAIDQSQLEINILNKLASYHWVIFSSTNAVKYFFYWLNKFKINISRSAIKYAVIGTATQNELLKHNTIADFIGKSKDSSEFAREFSTRIKDGQKILWATGDLSMNNIPNILGKHHEIKKLLIYQTQVANEVNLKLIDTISNNKEIIGIFLSPSAVTGFYNATDNKVDYQRIKFIPIGNTTAAAIENFNQNPLFIPSTPNIEILVNELNNYYN